jgi:hypothetical protein
MKRRKAKKSKPLGTDYKCECGEPGDNWHACPYASQLWGSEDECNCCDSCMSECSDNV